MALAEFWTGADCKPLAEAFAATGRRKILAVHLHHTWIPNQQTFSNLVARLGSGEAAGRELQRRMRQAHLQSNLRDIAQHVTIDPDGLIWRGRDWNLAPASAYGGNGSSVAGPFMIEMIGDFDIGREKPTTQQWSAMLQMASSIQQVFGLHASALVFEGGLAEDSTSIDKEQVIADLSKQARAAARAASATDGAGPVPGGRTLASLVSFADAAADTRADTIDEGGPPCAHTMSVAEQDFLQEGSMAGREDARNWGRGGGDNSDWLGGPVPTDAAARLSEYAINMRHGELSTDGVIRTSAADVQRIFRRSFVDWTNAGFKDWQKADPARANAKPKLLIFAHGGVVSEKKGVNLALHHYRAWLANGIYPVFVIWETGFFEVLMRAKERELEAARGGREWPTDDFYEQTIGKIAKPTWTAIKAAARAASQPSPNWAGHLMALELAALQANTDFELHLVGHSAGAIWHSHFVEALARKETKAAVKSLQLLAPACTIELFKQTALPQIQNGAIESYRHFMLDRVTERRDWTMNRAGYGASILCFVSGSLEDRRNTPLAGMQEYVSEDFALSQALGLASAPVKNVSVIVSPTAPSVPAHVRASSLTHGFDSDSDAMTAVAMHIAGTQSEKGFVRFPDFKPSRSGEGRGLLDGESPWDAIDASIAGKKAGAGQVTPGLKPATPAMSATAAPLGGARKALCIGIDNYPNPRLRLGGCVADMENWRRALAAEGFSCATLSDAEATRAGILNALANLFASARPGDLLVVHYSGHGTQFEDASSDEDDRLDEAIVPYDCESQSCIVDDDLRGAIAGKPDGVSLVMFLDCCHSGSATRLGIGLKRGLDDSRLRARFVKPTDAMVAAWRAQKTSQRARALHLADSAGEADMDHVQFAACQDNEVAYEYEGAGRFSLVALSVLAKARGRSYRDVAVMIEREMAERFGGQTPKLEGPPRLKDTTCFVTAG